MPENRRDTALAFRPL